MNGKKAKRLRREAKRQIAESRERDRVLGTQTPLSVMPEKVVYKAIKRLSK